MKTVLITGANRGLGLEFTTQYLVAGWHVHACCRNPEASAGLATLAKTHPSNLTIHTLDVADFNQIAQLANKLSASTIDLLINNAGVYPDRDGQGLGEMDYEDWGDAFRVNAMAPLHMTEAFIEHVARSVDRKIVFITSKMGSLEDNTSGGCYAYRSSKAALNMVAKSLSIDLAPRGVVTLLLHPGWARTDMGGPNAWISAQQSVSGMRNIITNATLADAGKFHAYDGKLIPW